MIYYKYIISSLNPLSGSDKVENETKSSISFSSGNISRLLLFLAGELSVVWTDYRVSIHSGTGPYFAQVGRPIGPSNY